MEPRRMVLWQARIMWLAIVLSAPAYCIVAFIVALQDDGAVLDWAGVTGAAPLLPASVLLPACAFLVPVLLALLRVVVVGSAAGRRDTFAAQPEDESAALASWLRRQTTFFVLGEGLPLLALLYVVLWGMMPLLWLVAAECVMVMALYFPRLPHGARGER